jgi:rare lipoprotein A (peptidoglycan hydrolase)
MVWGICLILYAVKKGNLSMKKMIMIVVSGLFVTAICAAQTQTSGNAPFRQEGIASWYGMEFEGRPTASGELFDPNQFTAAHPDLPFGTLLIVTNVINGEQVVVRVNDRGPFVKTRIIDVSKAAAEKLNMLEAGTAQVVIELAPKGSVSPLAANTQSYPEARSNAQAQTSSSSARTSFTNPPQSMADGQTPPKDASVSESGSPDVVSAAVPPETAASGQTAQARPMAPVTTQSAQPATVPNTVVPAYTPQQPALVQTPQPPLATRQPVQISPEQTAPVSRTQNGAQPAYPPVASFQPVPTATRPPLPQATVPTPSMPNSAIAPTISKSSAPVQPSRSWPRYESADISGGPFVKGRYYRIQIGSFKVAKNAVEAFDRLSAAGLNPQWEPFGELFRVVISNVRSDDINSIAIRLGNAGFKEAIAREER